MRLALTPGSTVAVLSADRSGADRNGTYDGRFAQFYDAIKKKYPQLKVISSCGYEQSPSLWVKSRTPDLVDEHYYRNMEEMMAQSLKYDTYSRTNESKIFCGEWATRVGSPTPNMSGALGDAAWMTVAPDRSRAVLFFFQVLARPNVGQVVLRAKGLDPDRAYTLEGGLSGRWNGDELMGVGLRLPDLKGDFQSLRISLKS